MTSFLPFLKLTSLWVSISVSVSQLTQLLSGGEFSDIGVCRHVLYDSRCGSDLLKGHLKVSTLSIPSSAYGPKRSLALILRMVHPFDVNNSKRSLEGDERRGRQSCLTNDHWVSSVPGVHCD